MARRSSTRVSSLGLDFFDERFGGYRLGTARVEPTMIASLREFGQLSPVVCCQREEVVCLLDGYQRLSAARQIELPGLSVLFLEVDDRQAKAAMYRLNQGARRIHVLEEAWIVQALVREDGLSQAEVAELLGRHKTWVCRRLALLEKLAPQARQDLQLGLLSVTAARELLRLPHGNQLELLECLRRESLTTGEIREVVDLLLACEHTRATGVRLGKASAGDFAGSWRPDSQLGSAAEHGGQPCGTEAGLAVWTTCHGWRTGCDTPAAANSRCVTARSCRQASSGCLVMGAWSENWRVTWSRR